MKNIFYRIILLPILFISIYYGIKEMRRVIQKYKQGGVFDINEAKKNVDKNMPDRRRTFHIVSIFWLSVFTIIFIFI